MDGLCLKPGIPGISPAAIGGFELRLNPPQVSSVATTAAAAAKKTTPFSTFSLPNPLRSFWTGRVGGGGGRGEGGRYGVMTLDDAVSTEEVGGEEKVVVSGSGDDVSAEDTEHVRSLRSGDEQRTSYGEMEDFDGREGSDHGSDYDSSGGCSVDDDDDEKEAEVDRDSFSRLLRRVSLPESRLYAQMSYLGNIAYCIPKIQTENLLRCYNLRFVTSSIDKRELTSKVEISQDLSEKEPKQDPNVAENSHTVISASNPYQIAASAASYLLSHTKSILPFSSSKDEDKCSSSGGGDGISMASLMATTDSVTAVVAAKEEVKQAVADDLNSTHSSPCEWYVCDEDESGTRFFAIQGSETVASWLANLLFEPVQFEGLDVIVHRGIYEAAKGLYEQMLPEIRAHLKARGDQAKFRFTGHSLGGSLALLINLMLLIRKEAPVSALLPVVTFGAPSIMCGGDRLLHKLGLPRSHVKAITMHRDIVPRAFSCHYPNQVAEFLKAVNGNFRNHPCLDTQNLLYAPMGDLLILQPDEKFSPSHHLLPAGIGLYVLTSGSANPEKRLRALREFLNSPHPLEILGDRSAYGSEGAVQRNHDMNSYLKCIRGFMEQERSRVKKAKKESRRRRRRAWWPPIVGPLGVEARIVAGGPNSDFTGTMVRTGRDSLRRFSRLVTSQHMHLLVMLLVPVRLLLLGADSVISLIT